MREFGKRDRRQFDKDIWVSIVPYVFFQIHMSNLYAVILEMFILFHSCFW